MRVPRLVVAVAILAALAVGYAALAAWTERAPGASGEFPVDVRGPEGAIFSGRVRVEAATALTALQAAAAEGGFEVRVVEYPGMGAYVVAIDGHEARGAAGWVYEATRGGAVLSGDRSASRFALQPGDALLWKWTDGGA